MEIFSLIAGIVVFWLGMVVGEWLTHNNYFWKNGRVQGPNSGIVDWIDLVVRRRYDFWVSTFGDRCSWINHLKKIDPSFSGKIGEPIILKHWNGKAIHYHLIQKISKNPGNFSKFRLHGNSILGEWRHTSFPFAEESQKYGDVGPLRVDLPNIEDLDED